MLLPSSIHRAEDFVGIAMPMVGLVCANALPPSAMVARLASASADNVVFLSMLLLPLILVAGRRARHVADRSSLVEDCSTEFGLVTSSQLASFTSGSGRPFAETSITKVRPCPGSAARAASSMPCQAEVTSRREKSGPTKAGQLLRRAGTSRQRRCSPVGL